MNPCLEAMVLLFLADFQPVLDQDNALPNGPLLEERGVLQECLVFLAGAEAHHMLDASPVVPTAVENDDFTRRRKVGDIALGVQLGFLAFGRLGQGYMLEDARTDPFPDALDGASFARGVTSLKHDNHF